MESKNGNIVKYPVGQQSFEMLRKDECLYVDKTAYIEQIVKSGSKYFFLGRPRRFGKSLFLSTLQCFFEGKRELFKGTYIDSTDWTWEKHPVLYLDLNIKKYKEKGDLEIVLDYLFNRWEEEFGIEKNTDDSSTRFANIIYQVYKKSGDKGVVVLVDEYDKPLVNNLHDTKQFEYYCDKLAEVYSNFKSSAPYLELVFLTGVSRFGKLSVFSGLNNISDISFYEKFADICGISEKEFSDNFQAGIQRLADKYGTISQEMHDRIKKHYDGYHFCDNCPDIYNPFSIMSLMDSEQFLDFWVDSGTPTLLWEQLKRFNVDLRPLLQSRCDMRSLQGLDLENKNPEALLYQTGYLTIKKVLAPGMYQLGLPNEEVREGFMSFLLPRYANLHDEKSAFFIYDFVNDLGEGNVDAFMCRLQKMFAGITYEMNMDCEKNLHNALYVFMLLLGLKVEAEYRTSNGRIDLFIATDRYYYIIEIKINQSAQAALDQINSKNYALPFQAEGRQIVKIGVNFSTADRTLTDWLVEK